jgi:hypothetical protein
MTKVLALSSSPTPMRRRAGTTPLLYLQPVFVVCATMSLLAVRDAISVCAAKLTIEKWYVSFTYLSLLSVTVWPVQTFARYYALSTERRRPEKAFGGFDIEIPRRTRTCTAHRCHQQGETTMESLLMTHISVLRQSATVVMIA